MLERKNIEKVLKGVKKPATVNNALKGVLSGIIDSDKFKNREKKLMKKHQITSEVDFLKGVKKIIKKTVGKKVSDSDLTQMGLQYMWIKKRETQGKIDNNVEKLSGRNKKLLLTLLKLYNTDIKKTFKNLSGAKRKVVARKLAVIVNDNISDVLSATKLPSVSTADLDSISDVLIGMHFDLDKAYRKYSEDVNLEGSEILTEDEISDSFTDTYMEKFKIRVNSKGKKTRRKVCPKGMKNVGGQCKKVSGSEKVKKKKGLRKRTRTVKAKGAGFLKRRQRKTKKALKKRRSFGLR